MWPVYEFRPLPSDFSGEFWRYADGKWLSDDGDYDLAFYGRGHTGAPMVYGVDISCQRNVLWSWLSEKGNWGKHEPKHPRGNAWHYLLRDGEREWGGPWERERHQNRKAYNDGMNRYAALCGCANGSGPCFNPDDPHIMAGLVRVRSTGEVVIPPDPLGCMYCKKIWPRRASAAVNGRGSVDAIADR